MCGEVTAETLKCMPRRASIRHLSTGKTLLVRRTRDMAAKAPRLTARPVLAVITGCPQRALTRQRAFRLARPGPQEATMKRTYQASKVRRARTHGFLVRMKSRGGRAVINARRAKGRKRLAV